MILSHIKKSASVQRTDVLVLGNSPQINNIDFNLIRRDIITLGVNRIWLKFVPNFLFFHDVELIREIKDHPEIDFSNTTLIVSDWLKDSTQDIDSRFKEVLKFDRKDKRAFPDSVSTAIQIFATDIMPEKKLHFYVAGVLLKWNEPSHFWKSLKHKSSNNHSREWYSNRFPMMFRNFQSLIMLGYVISSVTPNSTLNRICKSYDITHLYRNTSII